MQIPSAGRYKVALQQISSQISPLQWKILEAHYLAPDHTASAMEIALAAGKQWRATNLHYGHLASNLRRYLGVPLQTGEQQTSIVANFERPRRGFTCWRWVMHAPLADAIQRLGWFDGESIETTNFYSSFDDWNAVEGRTRSALRIHRHREMRLRRAKLDEFRSKNGGRLFCQVPGCGFDFELVYGRIGHGFAEVHHLKPLSELSQPTSTTLEDLAVVCANCHRMIHRSNSCLPLECLIRQ